MAFNGSGTYSLPAGQPVVTGTVISSTTFNTLTSDLATALTLALCKDGQSTPTANIKMGGFKITGLAAGTTNGDAVRFQDALTFAGGQFTGAISFTATCGINESKTTVASVAGSPDIWTSTGNVIDYTGALTATGFAAAPQAGSRRTLICSGAAPFTAGANMLIDGYASGNNFVARAGDQIQVFAVTTTQFRLTPLTWGNVLLATASASASATIDFTVGINSSFDEYLITISDMVPATDATALNFRISEDSGSTFKAGGTDYAYTQVLGTDGGAPAGAGSTGATALQIASNLANNKAFSGEIRIFSPSGTARTKMISATAAHSPAGGLTIRTISTAGAYFTDSNAINGVRFLMSAGNITAGNFALYGVRKT